MLGRLIRKEILDHLKENNNIKSWEFTGAGERFDYQVIMPDDRITIIETKGCLDGNNTNIFERPPQADEFIIWSLCQNPGADPRKNARSGIHTRLSAEIIQRRQCVDGVIIWDMVCGTVGRPCPKLQHNEINAWENPSGHLVPPPCIFLFPRNIPDPRNNPEPPSHTLDDIAFLKVLADVFGTNESDCTQVKIRAKMRDAEVQRQTECIRNDETYFISKWTSVKRAHS